MGQTLEMTICSEDECESKAVGRGLCSRHWQRWRAAKRAAEAGPLPECACGCGATVTINHQTKRPNQYLSGHNTRVAHPMEGVRHTEEAKAKIREARARQTHVVGGGPVQRPPVERFFDFVSIPADCWLWTGGTNPQGYGVFGLGSTRDGTARSMGAHRFAYELMVGAVPEGLELDHLCNNRACVNPSHLEPVTHAENVRRAGARRRERET